jgi:hypothetical protein
MALTIVGYLAARLAVTYWVRPRLSAPREIVTPVTMAGHGPGAQGGGGMGPTRQLGPFRPDALREREGDRRVRGTGPQRRRRAQSFGKWRALHPWGPPVATGPSSGTRPRSSSLSPCSWSAPASGGSSSGSSAYRRIGHVRRRWLLDGDRRQEPAMASRRTPANRGMTRAGGERPGEPGLRRAVDRGCASGQEEVGSVTVRPGETESHHHQCTSRTEAEAGCRPGTEVDHSRRDRPIPLVERRAELSLVLMHHHVEGQHARSSDAASAGSCGRRMRRSSLVKELSHPVPSPSAPPWATGHT